MGTYYQIKDKYFSVDIINAEMNAQVGQILNRILEKQTPQAAIRTIRGLKTESFGRELWSRVLKKVYESGNGLSCEEIPSKSEIFCHKRSISS